MKKRRLIQPKIKRKLKPEEPKIVFTFDDAFLTDYTIAKPLFDQYGLKATSFAVPTWVGTDGFCTWEQLRDLYASDNWDVQCHTFTHRLMGDLGEEELIGEYESVNQAFTQNGLPLPTSTAYPFGSTSELSYNVVENYRAMQRKTGRLRDGCNLKRAIKSDDRLIMHAMSVDMETEAEFEEIKEAILWGVENRRIIVLYCHKITPEPDGYEYNITEHYLEELLKFLSSLGIESLTMSELYEYLTPTTR